MDFNPREEDTAIGDTVAGLIRDTSDLTSTDRDRELQHRGLGLDLQTACTVLRELGRVATEADWVGHLVATPLVLSAGGGERSALPDLARSWAVGTYRYDVVAHGARHAHGGTPLVQRSVSGTAVLAFDEDTASVWSGEAWTPWSDHDLVGRRHWHTTSSPAASVHALAPGTTVAVLAACRVAAASFMLGTGHAALDLAVRHAQQREQFGRPIGSFQAVKHLLAGALEDLVMAAPLVTAASSTAQGRRASAPVDAALAARQAGRAAEKAVRAAIQVHGALAYTDETPLGALLAQVRATNSVWSAPGKIDDLVADALRQGLLATSVVVEEGGL
jgi:hypothetical protein